MIIFIQWFAPLLSLHFAGRGGMLYVIRCLNSKHNFKATILEPVGTALKGGDIQPGSKYFEIRWYEVEVIVEVRS